MAKPKKTSFGEEFEPILLSAWGSIKEHMDEALIDKTRRAVSEIRRYYRFKNVYPSKIRYSIPRNRAGYLAAFGQCHAYLSYIHLKRLQNVAPSEIPRPNSRELVVTILGAGAALEAYGLCLFYCEESFKIRKLNLNVVEKVKEWQSTRNTVLNRWIKVKFPKLDISTVDIDADLAKDDCIQKLSYHYDQVVMTDILIIYNVLNEIEVRNATKVWRNLDFILKICDKRLLVLLMEPCAPKARARVDWLIKALAQHSRVIDVRYDEEIRLDSPPTEVAFEGTGIGLNDRLFSRVVGGSNPALQTSIRRTNLACIMDPRSPISQEEMQKQLKQVDIKRGKKGRFAPSAKRSEGEQLSMPLDTPFIA